jgi:hypothetical protein
LDTSLVRMLKHNAEEDQSWQLCELESPPLQSVADHTVIATQNLLDYIHHGRPRDIFDAQSFRHAYPLRIPGERRDTQRLLRKRGFTKDVSPLNGQQHYQTSTTLSQHLRAPYEITYVSISSTLSEDAMKRATGP